jgi:hypothetical protein
MAQLRYYLNFKTKINLLPTPKRKNVFLLGRQSRKFLFGYNCCLFFFKNCMQHTKGNILYGRKRKFYFNFHSRTVHLDIIKVFIYQLNILLKQLSCASVGK